MRKICVITGSRADYSPLWPVIRELSHNPLVNLHQLKTEGLFGHETYLKSQLQLIKPDIIVILGDRYETLIYAGVAAVLNIPICHLAGGDITEGSTDDAFRHAITKLAYWHFPECQLHADRIIRMGEDPERVFAYGGPAVDLLAEEPIPLGDIESIIGLTIKGKLALVCYHPETITTLSIADQYSRLLLEISKLNDTTFIFSGANEDKGGAELNYCFQKWADDMFPFAMFRPTFSQKIWTSLMHHADYLVGNSSGFVIEGLTLQRMREDVDANDLCIRMIGDRQKGRWQDALAMFNKERFPFGQPGTVAKKIADKIGQLTIPETTRKRFYD